jgi:hypothetical protein
MHASASFDACNESLAMQDDDVSLGQTLTFAGGTDAQDNV